jgi:hypothetical protein
MLALALTLALSQSELPEARVIPGPPEAIVPSVLTRSLLATSAGTLAGPVSLGIALLLVGQNERFDPTFATAALSSLLVTGAAFTIHQMLGGRGEITLGFLLCAAVMAGAGGLASAINPSRDVAPILVVAIGSLPAAAAAVLGLEGTSPQQKPKARLAMTFAPNGVSGTF